MEKLPQQKLDVKLIALDLDDTLLNKEALISEKNLSVLRRCAALGIYIVLCSGRAESGILPFVHKMDIAGTEAGRYLVAINGSSVFDLHSRKQILSRKVEGDVLSIVNAEAEKMGLRSEVYTADTIYFAEETEWTKIDVELCHLKGQVVDDYENFITQGFSKMLVPGEPEKLQVLQARLKEILGERAVIFVSKPFFLEIMPPDCGKGEALLWLADHVGIDAKQTIAFGDSMNDENMIVKCGYGVCMQNGLDYIKNVADFVTEKTNDEDGVGDFIEKYIL